MKGEEAVYEVTRKICDETLMPVFGEKLPKLDTEGRIRDRIFAWAIRHGMNVEIEEDDEKYVFHIPCDTGGHLVAKAESGRTRQPYTWSCGESGGQCPECGGKRNRHILPYRKAN